MDATTLSIVQNEDSNLVPSYRKLPLSIEKGDGLFVWDATGNRYLDLYGGHAVCLLGHSHPALLGALRQQATSLFFYSNVAYNSTRATAAVELVNFVGGNKRVFFSNSGAEANENALKIARLLTKRQRVVSLSGSFHGRTEGSLSITGIDKYRHNAENKNVRFARFGEIEHLRSQMDESIAALIIEPIQSLTGIIEAPKEYFLAAEEICREVGALLIIDEIQTGLGRCGSNMYYHQLGIDPDIATVAKGIAGGFPAAATLVKSSMASDIQIGDLGSTFGGGPMACALITATLNTINKESLANNAVARHNQLLELLANLDIQQTRGKGLLIGIECKKPAGEIVAALREKGILVGPSLQKNTIRLLPPLCIGELEVNQFAQTLESVL